MQMMSYQLHKTIKNILEDLRIKILNYLQKAKLVNLNDQPLDLTINMPTVHRYILLYLGRSRLRLPYTFRDKIVSKLFFLTIKFSCKAFIPRKNYRKRVNNEGEPTDLTFSTGSNLCVFTGSMKCIFRSKGIF